MDPASIAGAILGIIDVSARCIFKVVELYQRFKDAELSMRCLLSRLRLIATSLNQIQKYVPQTPQPLQADLLDALECCNLIFGHLDKDLGQLKYRLERRLGFGRKLRFAISNQGTSSYIAMLDQQISALQFLMLAVNCQSSSGQRDLLEAGRVCQLLDESEQSPHGFRSGLETSPTTEITGMPAILAPRPGQSNVQITSVQRASTTESTIREPSRTWSSATLVAEEPLAIPKTKLTTSNKVLHPRRMKISGKEAALRQVVIVSMLGDFVFPASSPSKRSGLGPINRKWSQNLHRADSSAATCI